MSLPGQVRARLQGLWARRPGADRRARDAAIDAARRLAPLLAAALPDLEPRIAAIGAGRPRWDTLLLAWDRPGAPRLHGPKALPAHLRLALADALALTPAEHQALALHGPVQGSLLGAGPWILWIGDDRHRPHDSPIGPAWPMGPPAHGVDGTSLRIAADGGIRLVD